MGLFFGLLRIGGAERGSVRKYVEEDRFGDMLLDAILVGPAVDNLPTELREPVLLHYFAGCSPPEVGRYLGTTAGAVRTRLWRARQSLRGVQPPVFRPSMRTRHQTR